MASLTLISNSTTAVSLTAAGDTLTIAAGVSLVTTSGAVTLAGALFNGDVLLDGRIVSSRGDGITLGSSSGQNQGTDILISSEGGLLAANDGVKGFGVFTDILNEGYLMAGARGVALSGSSNVLVNRGDISGTVRGVLLLGDNCAVTNSGEISARTIGVSMSGGGISISNSGLISSSFGQAVTMSGAAGATARIVNSGTIDGSVVETLANATLTNTGVITGDIDLGAGNDTLRLLSGSVSGEIKAGDGDDLIVLGSVDFEVSGGAGADTLSVVRNTVLSSDIENLTLRGGDNLRGVGNSDANILTGNRGDNTLKGLGGKDILNGGRGDDLLIGGSAKDGVRDTFVFSLDCGADRIRGFQITGAGDDRIDLGDFADKDVFDDFADLKANFMRQSGDNAIIDLPGDDRVTIENVKLADFRASDFIF